MIESAVFWLLGVLALPAIGLPSVFIISFISATLLPLGSEPTVFAVVKANQELFWSVIAVATVGNTLGGVVNYWMGLGAKLILARERDSRWFGWVQRHGSRVLLLSWLPVVGDPLCVIAGWQKTPFWPSVFYMALGKFLRYLAITWGLLYIPNAFWRSLVHWS